LFAEEVLSGQLIEQEYEPVPEDESLLSDAVSVLPQDTTNSVDKMMLTVKNSSMKKLFVDLADVFISPSLSTIG